MGELTRRDFIRTAALAGAATAASAGLAGCASNSTTSTASTSSSETTETSSWRTAPEDPAESEIVDTEECDVLVIGLGQAGCCAARAAAEAGAKVYMFHDTAEDKLTFRGGGQVGHINSKFLASKGVPTVDVVDFLNDWQVRSNNRSNPALVMKYAKECGDCFDWLFDELTSDQLTAMQVRQLEASGPFERTCSGIKTWVGTALTSDYTTEALTNCISIAVDKGGKVFYSTPGYKLIQDSTGKVTGAYGKGTDGYVKVTASKGVILTAGGFGSNADMCADLLYEIDQRMSPSDSIACSLDASGKGIQLGYWAGGRLDPCMGTMDGAYWYPTDGPTDPLGATAALWINADGKRYSNEGFGSTELQAMPGAQQPSGIISTLFDANVEGLLKAQPFGHMSFDYANGTFDSLHETMDKAYAGKENGSADTTDSSSSESEAGTDKAQMASATVYAADDFKTLGTYLGYTGDALTNFVASIEEYNAVCAAGVDTDFGKDSSLLFPLTTPPYYGYKGTKTIGSLMVTVGGLLIDADGQVLDEDYNPISGLFAAGNNSGSRFGWQYFTSIAGQSLSMAQTLGMTTGTYVASL